MGLNVASEIIVQQDGIDRPTIGDRREICAQDRVRSHPDADKFVRPVW